MKLSFVPIVIVAVCLLLMVSLLVLHSSPKHYEGTHKSAPTATTSSKKSFDHLKERGAVDKSLDSLGPSDKGVPRDVGESNGESQSVDIHSPTSPPIPDGVEVAETGAKLDSKSTTENDKPGNLESYSQRGVPALGLTDPSIKESIQAAELEARIPPNFALNDSVLESLRAAADYSEQFPLVAPVVQITLPPASHVQLAPILYSGVVTVERSSEVGEVFKELRALHDNMIRSTLHNARTEADTIQPEQHFPETASTTEIADSSFEFHALSRLHRALRTGKLCTPNVESITGSNLYLAVHSLFEGNDILIGDKDVYTRDIPKLLIEYLPNDVETSNTIAFALAAARPTVTALILQFPTIESSAPSSFLLRTERARKGWNAYTSDCVSERAGSNLYVADGENNALDGALLSLDCAQVIPNLDMLVHNLLPFEFEEMLGNLLCRCNVTFIPQTLPETPYFAFWDSTQHLLQSVEKVLGDICAISFDMSSYNSKLISTVRSSHIVVRRNASVSHSEIPSVSSSTARSGRYSSSYDSASSSSFYNRYSSHSAPAVAVSDVEAESADSINQKVASIKQHYPTVRLLSSLSLDQPSRHHLWSSVLARLSASEDISSFSEAGPFNETVIADLIVYGASVHTATEIATEKLKIRTRFDFSTDSVPVTSSSTTTSTLSLGAVDATTRVSEPIEVHHSVMSAAEDPQFLPASSEHKSAMSAAEGPPIRNPDNVVESILNTTTHTSRRKLYVVAKQGSSTSSSTNSRSYVSSSSRVSSSSVISDVLPDNNAALSWDYPDLSQSGQEEFDEVDSLIRSTLNTLERRDLEGAHSGDSSRSSAGKSGRNSAASKKFTLSSRSRELQRHLHTREANRFRRWMSALKFTPISLLREKQVLQSALEIAADAGIVYVMGRQVSLLSMKLSKLLSTSYTDSHQSRGSPVAVDRRRTILVSLLSDSLSFHAHAILSGMMTLRNNIIGRPKWTPALLSTLLGSPERGGLSIVQGDVIVELIVNTLYERSTEGSTNSATEANVLTDCKAELLEESIAALLSISTVSLVEVPSVMFLRQVFTQSGMSDICIDLLYTRYSSGPAKFIEMAVQRLKLGVTAEVIQVPAPAVNIVGLFRISLQHSPVSCEENEPCAGAGFTHKASNIGVSLYTLLQLGVIEEQKKTLLKMLIDFPLWKVNVAADVRPWELFVSLASGENGSPVWAMYYNSVHSHSQSADFGGINAVSRNQVGYRADAAGDSASGYIGVSERGNSAHSDRVQGRAVWKALEHELATHGAELSAGRFSFVEHNSGFGYVSLRIAKSFPNATVISIERCNEKVKHHIAMLDALLVQNNAVCRKTDSDEAIFKNIYESPELFRFQLQSHSMLDGFVAADSLVDWGAMVGTMLSTALTTFVYAPHSAQVSWAMFLMFSEVYEFVPAHSRQSVSFFRRLSLPSPVRVLSDLFGDDQVRDQEIEKVVSLNLPRHHPQYPYRDFEKQWVLKNARVRGGSTAVQVSPLTPPEVIGGKSSNSDNHATVFGSYSLPLVRCDIVNMTRHVHHHYESSKDGHKRTYTMRVKLNQTLTDTIMSQIGDPSLALSLATGNGVVLHTATHNSIYSNAQDNSVQPLGEGYPLPPGYHPNQHGIVGVHLFRDRDTFPIPYTSIYGVTLISALRLGMEDSIRDRLFKDFLAMPLYEDMAPWNVVLMGKTLDYIDYDTRDITFNKVIPQAYQVMTVLMNYKRTVEDFKRCGSKSSTVYGLPYVSDCVGSNVDRSMSCPDLKLPVPCADGNCHSDYISCLRAITDQAEQITMQQQKRQAAVNDALAEQGQHISAGAEDSHIVAAMKSIVGQFNDNSVTSKDFDAFFKEI